MRSIRLILVLFITATLATKFTPHVHAACSKEFTVGFMEIDPGYRTSKSTTPRGRDLEIFDKVMLHAECSYTLTKMPWKRVIVAIKNGIIDATISASNTPDRQTFALFSRAFRHETMAIFMRRSEISSLSVNSLHDIINSNLNIGVHLGSWYGETFHTAIIRNPKFRKRVLQSSDFRFLHNWLLIGRVDVVLDELHSGLNYVHDNNIEDKVWYHPTSAHENPVHFMFSKATVTQRDVDQIDQALNAFLTTNEYSALMKRFSSTSTKP
ncbi:MAG: substrate-binding periplasmic protein [Kordiimonas sp.]